MGSDFFSDSTPNAPLEVWTLPNNEESQQDFDYYFAPPATRVTGNPPCQGIGTDLVVQDSRLWFAESSAMHLSGETSDALQTTSGVGIMDEVSHL